MAGCNLQRPLCLPGGGRSLRRIALQASRDGATGERLARRARFLPQIVALAFSLMLAFSQSMWSQAVIAEVYALHALLIAVFLILCYSWVHQSRE